ncbi:MAG: hypothetical protein LC107_13285 [Chitinophagales bacterium]|nr:hypothetical protein [Chitinophagales bacterium]
MNKYIVPNLLRILILFLVQILVFKQITFTLDNKIFVHFLIYPLAILQLPIKTPRMVLLLVAFILGIGLDVFYDSLGIHAAALVLTAYIRGIIIAMIEPYEGYNVNDVPTIRNFGIGWFVYYLSLALIIHIFVYFSIEAFSFVYFFEIMLNSIFSFIVSFIVIMLSQLIFRPKF